MRRQLEAADEGSGGKKQKVEEKSVPGSGLVNMQSIRSEGIASMYRELRDALQLRKFSFVRTEYAIIDTSLSYIPLQHSASALFTQELRKYMSAMAKAVSFKFFAINLSAMKVRNPIVLSDQIQLTASGSTEVSSFVQSAKILHYRLGGPVFPANMYSFKRNDETLVMAAEDLYGGQDEVKAHMMRTIRNSDGLAEITVNPLKQFNDFVVLCDEMKLGVNSGNTKIPYQMGHLRLPSVTVAKKNLQYMDEAELETKYLQSFPHDYLQPGSEVDIILPPESRVTTSGLMPLLETQKTMRGTISQYVFCTWPGYKNRVLSPAIANHHVLEHKACKSRQSWHLHDYFTMVPIKASSGNIMKLRASVEINLKFDIIIGATGNSFTDNPGEQFNVMLDVPFNLPYRGCDVIDANTQGALYCFH